MNGKEGATAETNSPKPSDKEESVAKTPSVPHLLYCGSTKWDILGRKLVPKAVLDRGGSDAGEELLGPTRFLFDDFPDLRPRAVFSGPCSSHFIIVSEDGKAYGMGRNDNAQLARDDLCSRQSPILFEFPSTHLSADSETKDDTVLSAACGRNHTIIVMKSGNAFAVGHNLHGQLGTGDVVSDGAKITYNSDWKRVAVPVSEKVVSAAAGADFSIFACESGAVYASGSGQHGQLGNGRTGECIETRNRVAYDSFATPIRVHFIRKEDDTFTTAEEEDDKIGKPVRIKQVAAGVNHSLALDTNGRVWSWGFGGYGRLGHKSPKDELRPRLIETFDAPYFNLDYISCGMTCSYAVQLSRRSTYFWGVAKKSGESNMYPKTVFDLQGSEVHCLACGVSSTVAAADRNVVSWGPSPCVGELGYGTGIQKSSTKPKIMESVEGLYCKCIAEGCAFTVMVVDAENDEEREILEKLDYRNVAGSGTEEGVGDRGSGTTSDTKRKEASGAGRGKKKSKKRKR